MHSTTAIRLCFGIASVCSSLACSTTTPAKPTPAHTKAQAATVRATSNKDTPALRYDLELVQQPFRSLHVTVSVAPNAQSFTRFTLCSDWGGINDCFREFHGLTAHNEQGSPLSFERINNNVVVVQHTPGESVKLSYYIVPIQRELGVDSSSYYRPFVDDKMMNMFGDVVLAVPEHLSDGEHRIALRYHGFDTAKWTIVSSHSVEQSGFDFQGTLDSFAHTLFMAGSLRINKQVINGNKLYVVIVGDDWRFTDQAFVSMAGKIVQAERDFFADHSLSHYVITLLPVGTADAEGSMTGGTGLTTSFATFMTPNVSLSPGSDTALRIKHLLAHEMFHQWNGIEMKLRDPEELGYWFSEGFTDFYTRRLLYRAGLIDLDGYLAMLNEQLQNYQTSPVRNADNNRIRKDFWRDNDVQKLPYQRGDLIALLLDTEIRKANQGSMSLDDIMRDLHQSALQSHTENDTESLFAEFATLVPKERLQQLRSVVDNGGALVFSADTLSPCFKLVAKSQPTFDLGFDFSASQKAGVVTSLSKNSNAYKAGLREGQALKSWSISRGKTLKPVTITVVVDGQSHALTYLPSGAEQALNVFEVGDAQDLASCEQIL